jgi:tRNA-specific 2-thiouridylase
MTHPQTTAKHILVATGGGVASLVSAALLKSQGSEVTLLSLDFTDPALAPEKRFKSHCAQNYRPELIDQIAKKLGVRHVKVSAHEHFDAKVADNFVHELIQMRRPNPCLRCTKEVKFALLFEQAEKLGCSEVATGHYAQVIHDQATGISRIFRALDAEQDQTHLLATLEQGTLGRVLFPLGGLTRTLVRKLAINLGLDQWVMTSGNSSPWDCFLQDEDFKAWLDQRVAPPLRPFGVIRTTAGQVVGDHHGVHRFFIGQKKGFKINIPNPDQWLVTEFDPKSFSVILGKEQDLVKDSITASQVSWVRPVDQLRAMQVGVQIRPGMPLVPARLEPFANRTVHLFFNESQRALAAGQVLVFYEGDELLGAAMVEQTSVSPLPKIG